MKNCFRSGSSRSSAIFLGYNVLFSLMSTEQILDLIINYAYTRKKEIQKHKALLGNQQDTNSSWQIDDSKIMEIDNWIKFLIDVKNGKLDVSKTE